MTKIRIILAAAMTLGTLATASEAGAFSLGIKMACAKDYYAHCSQHSLSSPGVTKCMRAVGTGLSTGCINALVAGGYVSKAEVQRRMAAK
jgi:hypothetical protein